MELKHVTDIDRQTGTISGLSGECKENLMVVKLQLKHLANARSPQNWSGTAINPSYNWPDITEFS
jgi:hypothetical protein